MANGNDDSETGNTYINMTGGIYIKQIAHVEHLHATPEKEEETVAGLTKELLRPYINAGLLQENLQPAERLSNGEKAVLAHDIAERFKIKNFWALFGKLWEVKLLRTYYTSYLETNKAELFLKILKKLDYSYLN